MEEKDTLRLGDKVSVAIFGPEGSCIYKSTGDGFHSLKAAVDDTLANSDINVNPEDCVFEVTNLSTNVSHRYRLNAHGHLKLII